MADPKVPARRAPVLPSVIQDVTTSDLLPKGNHWLGFEADVLERNTRVVDNSTGYLLARAKQSDAYIGLLRARMRIAHAYAEVLDLPNAIADAQREREHARAHAEHRRTLDTVNAVHELALQIAKNEAELAKAREQAVRNQRNREAAERVKDAEIDQWYSEATARRNEAEAVRQDSAADLQRGTQAAPSPDALKAARAEELAAAIATITNEIELARARGNAAGVLTLQNLLARLRAA
jgi:hypothetical protein